MLKVLAILRSDTARAALDSAVRGIDQHDQHACGVFPAEFETRVGHFRDMSAELDGLNGTDALLVDLDLEDPNEMDAFSRFMGKHATSVPIVASSTNATVDDIRRLMRLGVADFLPQPISAEELVATLQHVIQRHREVQSPDEARGTVLSFLKSRGGVGATVLAVQTACGLVERAKDDAEVCLIDLDLQYGNAALGLDAGGGHGIAEILDAPDRLDGSFLRELTFQHKCGVDVLAAPQAILPLDAVTAEVVNGLLEVARAEYRYVVVDLPHPWTTWKHAALLGSDHILLVTQLTVSAIRGARRQLDIIQSDGLGRIPLSVVANRFVKRLGSAVSVKDAEKALGRPIDYFIANDYKTVGQALNLGLPLREVKRGSKVEKHIRKLVEAAKKAKPGESRRAEPLVGADT